MSEFCLTSGVSVCVWIWMGVSKKKYLVVVVVVCVYDIQRNLSTVGTYFPLELRTLLPHCLLAIWRTRYLVFLFQVDRWAVFFQTMLVTAFVKSYWVNNRCYSIWSLLFLPTQKVNCLMSGLYVAAVLGSHDDWGRDWVSDWVRQKNKLSLARALWAVSDLCKRFWARQLLTWWKRVALKLGMAVLAWRTRK